MATAEYNMPISNMTGEWAPGCVCRQKRFRVGKKIVFGPKEIYHKNKRNYRKHPLTEGEKRNVEAFRKAEAQRKIEMQDESRRAYWEMRFAAQQTKPDPGSEKKYHRLDAYVRSMLMKAYRE